MSRDMLARRQVDISLASNRLESDVVYQMMMLFEQQHQQPTTTDDDDADNEDGCTLNVSVRNNRVRYFLDQAAAFHLNRPGS